MIVLPNDLIRLTVLKAFNTTLVQLLLVAVGTYISGENFVLWTYIDQNYVQILTANLFLAYAIAVFVYIRSFNMKTNEGTLRRLASGGCTGNTIYDWFIGRELNPCITIPLIGDIDIKSYLMMRPGLTGWLLLNLSFVAKQYRLHGYISNGIIFVALIQGYYVLEGQYAEAGILNMMDIKTDGLGFMLTFGDIVWVPFLYSIQCRYLAVYPVHLGSSRLVAVGAVFIVGVYIFRASNAQKITFRAMPHHPNLTDLSYIQTKKGTRLLTGGWWGLARHINYFGDWLQAVPFSLPTGLAGYLIFPPDTTIDEATDLACMVDGRIVMQGPAIGWGALYTYLYVVYFAVLLLHRERRDDAVCSKKYGKDWEDYKNTVPWRIIPGIY